MRLFLGLWVLGLMASLSCAEINRQAIVFHEATPEVFYCPQDKPISLEGKLHSNLPELTRSSYHPFIPGMIVKAKPLKKLCEHEGKPLPDDYVSGEQFASVPEPTVGPMIL